MSRCRPRERIDPGRAQGPLGRAGREPLQPPHRRLCQRDPSRPPPARLRRDRLEGAPRARDARDPHPRREKGRCWPTSGRSRPAARSTRSGTTASTSTSPPTRRSPAAARVRSTLKLEVHANSGSMLNGQDDKDRVVNYEYNLVYGLDGKVDETNPMAADWISVGGEAQFAPLNVLELVESRWGGHNQLCDRSERPVARPGQRRHRSSAARGTSADLPPGRGVRGRPSADVRRFRRFERPDASVRRVPPRILRQVTAAVTSWRGRVGISCSPAPLFFSGPTRRLAYASHFGPGLALSRSGVIGAARGRL